jgi:hypothetical protein
MVRNPRQRLYATLKNTPELLALYVARDLDGLTAFTLRLLRGIQDRDTRDHLQAAILSGDSAQPTGFLAAIAAPSLDWRAAFAPRRDDRQRSALVAGRDIIPDELIIAYDTCSDEAARLFLDLVNDHLLTPLDPLGNAFLGAGSDPGGSVLDHWCPGAANSAIFGHRRHARRTVCAEALTTQSLLGHNVNVVIIDEGLDKALIAPQNWGGGLDHYIDADLVLPAGTAPRTSHGMMIARSILDLAPQAVLYDVPVIPAFIESFPFFISDVQSAYASLIHEIRNRRNLLQWSGPWVLVNAWGIFDTSADPSGSYTMNTEPQGHPLINLVTRTVEDDHLDIVFGAGNCGQFCPEQQCGGGDRGPGRSIWGANAHPLVLTAGAVRSDETWVGFSSQGPGPELLATQKPDLCAPSQFCETNDANSQSTGSSASCAMTAGIVAALRSNPDWDQTNVPPQALKAALMQSARKPNGPPGWDNRMGFGIIDAGAAIASLS